MQVILLEKVGKLGNLGDKVVVKAGFGRNFLIPFGKAVPATAITAAGVEVSKSEVRLPEGVIRELGEFEVAIQLHSDLIQTIHLSVIPEA